MRASGRSVPTRRAVLGQWAAALAACPCCAAPPASARSNAAFARAMASSSAYERAARDLKLELFAQLDPARSQSAPVRVLCELGIGTGPNLRLLPERVRRDARVVGVEPNVAMHMYASRAAADARVASFELVEASGESLPFEAGGVDAVICTLTLCSVRSQEDVLREVRRVLKPGGRFIFVEHVLSEDEPFLALQQRALDPLQSLLADGCHVTRRTRGAIEAAGFAHVDARSLTLPGLWVVGPHVAGVAVA
ncbi:hypothetical protein KFE25_004115 [Diacronema lutheri]|uniref:Methyltransferase type 11 domain-containing protein n=1 Tax=Diacronema lutheri TaxID=2081491 RepID=A0A8J6C6W6_DIALT|nr:hypothetical protein KFE25_004115 [Diacronema lutheri]